ncbi:cytochrome oxidase subunit III [Lewinellaceae bacterium SD302]|nr:cytochrome oxidase subunit III [Lewinellaceae bacterium SD302]
MPAEDILVEEEQVEKFNDWSGGDDKPFRVSYGKLMMWYFLLSDAFTFAGFLIAYGTLRFSSASWPVPDVVFSTFPGGLHDLPLIFVTVMSFILIVSSATMVRAVQEGHRENKRGVVFWMLLTVIGGAGFLGCQAWEWNNLINKENMTVSRNPFGSHVANGVYLDENGQPGGETFEAGDTYLLHRADLRSEMTEMELMALESHGEGHEGDHAEEHLVLDAFPADFPDKYVDEDGFIMRKFQVTDGAQAGTTARQEYGPKAFGALFFGITGFHGFHVFSGVVFLLIILINAGSGVYERRENGYEMVEKIGLYWHFVDLVWVFVFLVFYLL